MVINYKGTIIISIQGNYKMKIEQKTIYNVYGKIKYYNHKTMKNEIITIKDSYFIVKRSDYNKQVAINKLLSDFPTINKNDIIINKNIETIYNYR